MKYELRALPRVRRSPLPEFNANGLLPPGDFQPTEEEFETRLAWTRRRRVLTEGWRRLRSDLLAEGLAASTLQLVNGSFTTAKPDPGDIDLAVETPTSSRELVRRPVRLFRVLALLRGPDSKLEYDCDAYPILCLPKHDPHYNEVTVKAILYWTKWFGHDRQGRPKGRVWVRTGAFE